MNRRRNGNLLSLCLIVGAVLPLGGCDWTKPKVPGAAEHSAKKRQDNARRLRGACASAETYDRLRALTFEEAMKIGSGPTQVLDSLSANSTIRMENPVAKSRDESLDITVCRGHLVLDLPPGVKDSFDGDRSLEADIEYSAQQAADGSGLVFQMTGAEPIIYRLAALTLPNGRGPKTVASAPPPPAPVAKPSPAPVQAAPAPTRTEVAAAPPRIAPPPPPPPPARPKPRPSPSAPAEVAVPQRSTPVATELATDRTQPRGRPSFDCGGVTSRVLQMVCSDPALAARDRRMSSIFYAALASGDEGTRRALRVSRDRFLGYRNRCPTPSCVAQAYDDRIAEIRDIADGR